MGSVYYFVLTGSQEKYVHISSGFCFSSKQKDVLVRSPVQVIQSQKTRGTSFLNKRYKYITHKSGGFNIFYRGISFFPQLVLDKTTRPYITIPNAAGSSKRGTENHMQKSLGSTKIIHFVPE